MKISVDSISANPQQPRQHFDEETVQQLTESIKAIGLEQPISVEDAGDGKYILVDGERRWRAHKLLGLSVIDANIRQLTNHAGRERLVSAMASNIARDSMNPVDEARAYLKMRDEMKMSVSDISASCGTSTTRVYQMLYIMKFTDEEQELMASRLLPVQHEALEALLSIPVQKDRIQMAKKLAERKATVKIVQAACKQYVEIKRQVRNEKRRKTPTTPALAPIEKQPREWDALYQVNRVPPWKNFTEAIMNTCDKCSLRSVASDATCRNCPLVEMVTAVMDGVK